MKTLLHSGASRLLTFISVLALSGILPACTDDADRELPDSGKGGTVTLELSLSVPPMLETKAVICEADSGSEARKAGFYYEMQVQTTDTTGNNGGHVATKAASSLKNIYAFLFKNNGTFNGRASIDGPVDLTQNLKLGFSDVTDVSSRLVVIANDAAAETNYTSSTDFASFTGTYTEFQKLVLTSGIKSDADIPYVGSTTVSLGDGVLTAEANVLLYRMLAKITLTNNYAISDGVLRNSIILYNAGNKYFDSGNGYDGSGTTLTAAGRYSFVSGKNDDSNTWYVGENVQSETTNAAYIEFQAAGEGSNTNPSVGQEYTISGYTLRHKVYLNGFALKRNNVYTIKVNMSGSFAYHKELAKTNPNVSYTELEVVHGGLNIGKFGGAEGYTTGDGNAPTISGSYTKYLLLQPNTTGSTAPDINKMYWSTNKSAVLQPDTRKYWDNTYAPIKMGGSTVSPAYKYCNELSFDGANDKGKWYLPTLAQLMAVWRIFRGIKENTSYADYSAFGADYYWGATEYTEAYAWNVSFKDSYVNSNLIKNSGYFVRCVRDLP